MIDVQFKLIPLVLIVLAASGGARGADKDAAFSTAEAVKTIAPFMDDDVIAIAHLDAARADADKFFGAVARFIPVGHALARMNLAAPERLQSFRKAGGRELYLIAHTADLPDPGPFVLVPMEKDSDEQALRALARDMFVDSVGDVLFFGAEATRRRLADGGPVARPELSRALESVAASQAQLAFIPSASARRVVEELLPTLPTEAGGGPTTTLTRGALWGALGADFDPDLRLRFVVQSQSPKAARTFQSHIEKLLGDRLPKGEKAAQALRPSIKDDRLQMTVNNQQLGELGVVLPPLADTLANTVRRRESTNQLKQIGLALHNYHDVNGHFAQAATTDDQGRPLLSWRVAILPFLGQEPLYRRFHLDEPWDSEHNRKLIEQMPDVFRSFASVAPAGRTSFVAATGPAAAFERARGIAIGEITDGTSNTLFAWETDDDHAEVWTKPGDYAFDTDHPSANFATAYPDGRLLLFCDGSVRFITQALDDETIRRLILRNDDKPLAPLR